MPCCNRSRRDSRRGATLIEFSLIAVLLIMVIFTIFEMDRLLLVTTALADSARAGVRYAIVHGSDNPATATQVTNVVKGVASTGLLDPNRLNITGPTYSSAGKEPGSTVNIIVTYPYDPFTRYFPLTVTLGSTSHGVITY